jgi:hypothetical protein
VSDTIYVKLLNECDQLHPAVGHPIAAFVYDYVTEETWHYNFSHPDVPSDGTLEDFRSKIQNKAVYVIDKKRYMYYLNGLNLIDINAIVFSNDGVILEVEPIKHSHIPRNVNEYNYIVSYVVHQTRFDEEVFTIKEFINTSYDPYSFRFFNEFLPNTLFEVERVGISVDVDVFKSFFPGKRGAETLYSRYNIYNATGRPSNNFDNINFVALNKDNGCRRSFVSRYDDGYYLMVDFTGFHPYLVSHLINYDVPEDETIYEHLAKQYYNITDVTKEDISNSKQRTMYNLYGDVKEENLRIPFFKGTADLKDEYWVKFERDGYVETPMYKRRITRNHIKQPNKNKLFAYIIQALETEHGINSVERCLRYTADKEINPILYVYDSVVFDVSPTVDNQTIRELIDIFKTKKFKIKAYTGKNYHDLTYITN